MAKIRDGSTYLDNHLCANDYYAEGESVAGQWQGQLAARLGLAEGQEIRADANRESCQFNEQSSSREAAAGIYRFTGQWAVTSLKTR